MQLRRPRSGGRVLVSRSPSRESTERCRPSVVALGDAVMPALLTDLGDLGPALERLEVVTCWRRPRLVVLGLPTAATSSREPQRQQLAGGHRLVAADDDGAADDVDQRLGAPRRRWPHGRRRRPAGTSAGRRRRRSGPARRRCARRGRRRASGCAARCRAGRGVSRRCHPGPTIDSAISARMSSQMPIGLGRREGLQLDGRVAEDGGGARRRAGPPRRPRGAAPCPGPRRATGRRGRADPPSRRPRWRRRARRGLQPRRSTASPSAPVSSASAGDAVSVSVDGDLVVGRLGLGNGRRLHRGDLRLRAGLGLLGILAASEDAHCLRQSLVCAVRWSCRSRHWHRVQCPPARSPRANRPRGTARAATCWTTSWAIRSPRRTVNASRGSRLTRLTRISPR